MDTRNNRLSRKTLLSILARYGIALGATALAALVRMMLPWVLAPVPYLGFYPAVVVSAALGGVGPGLVSTFVSLILVNYVFGNFNIHDHSAIARQIVWVTTGVGVSLLAGMQRSARMRVILQAEELRRLNEDLEVRVQQRTAEIQEVNNQLLAAFQALELETAERAVANEKLAEQTEELNQSLNSLKVEMAERQKSEEKLQTTLMELERSNKELEQFAYVASHDLQEPLRMVSSYTQLLAKRYEDQLDDKAKKFIDYAVDGAVRMQRLINDLLAYSRVSTKGKTLELIDSHSTLGEALRNLSAAIEENRAIVINDNLPTVRADTTQLIQLFQNLIGNAIKFRGADLPRIHISVCDLGSEWRFMVKDNGIGIDSQYAEKVFVIFQRLHTRQEYPGTGIGLAVCKRIVERHGGKIWFESEPGKGSMFFFTLSK